MIAENGQGKADYYEYLDRCCQLISETYGKPNRAEWTNSDYVRLSNILFRTTKVQISPNTLKRIFGKIKTDSRYYPQKATRDAMASYVGYSGWDHYVQVQELAEKTVARIPKPSVEIAIPALPAIPSRQPVRRRNWLVLVLITATLAVALAIILTMQQTESDVSAQLICRNPLGENPHSAVFEIRRSAPDESATYRIQFGDGKRRNMDVADSVYTHYYERPGRYFAILERNGKPMDTATVYLQTKGWTVTANMMHDSSRVYPIEVHNLFTNGQRSVSAQEAAHAGVDTNRTFFMEFINSQPTGIDGDNFELITHVKTSPDRAGVRCSQVGITVWGESSQHMFDVMKPGCVHWIDLQTSEVFKSGQRDDLNFLGADLRTGGMIRLKVVDKKARIFINNRKIYEARYQKSLRRVYGVRIQFAGIGTVDSFELRNLKTKEAFPGNF
ncbi:hypothetical protein IC229_12005 [Spirosoma sp. BT702]|uniref:PKD domain-containing protein n=1 Tax=Spirosoma profusum TaxID=2771354 RepID=A0A927AQY0_9BACT|nr:hypothetical protein [Spirosoma profusum]MBD2701366.1 hypothetical protein [Spirosoma profusum]